MHCYSTPIIYYITSEKCHLTDKFFCTFATLILWKEIQNFGCPCCSTHEDLYIDVSITNVWLIFTKLKWFQLFSTRVEIQFQTFLKKFKFLGFHVVVGNYSWRPFHWCIHFQCRNDIDKANVISALLHKSKLNFKLFFFKYLNYCVSML